MYHTTSLRVLRKSISFFIFLSSLAAFLVIPTHAAPLNQARVYETAHSGIQWPGLTTWYTSEPASCPEHGQAWDDYLCSVYPNCQRHTFEWLPVEPGVREANVCQLYLDGGAYSHWGYEHRDLDIADPKNFGKPQVCIGNPCDAATGNKYEAKTDYHSASGFLTITRHYNSELARLGEDKGIGTGWTLAFVSTLDIDTTGIRYHAPDGRILRFQNSGGVWRPDTDVRLQLIQDATGYLVTDIDGGFERFNLIGQLQSKTTAAGLTLSYFYTVGSLARLDHIVDPFGDTVRFGYDNLGSLATITNANEETIRYDYARVVSLNNRNLTRVTYPDGNAIIYHYENNEPPANPAGTIYYANQLTGISYVDTNGVATRYSTYHYNTNTGKADGTEHAGGMQHFSLNYDSDTQTTVSDAINTAEVMTFQTLLGAKNLVAKTNNTDGKALNNLYDANNNLVCQKDEEGKVTTYGYNTTNQRTATTEGLLGTCANPQTTIATRTISYTYLSSTKDLPTQITSPSVVAGNNKTTTIQYTDSAHPNLPTQITQNGYTPSGTAVSRSVGITYNAAGQVAQIDGPRIDASDITTFAYNNCTTGGGCGQLASIKNALNQTTTFDSYDLNGRALQTTGPNGLRTNYLYDPRGRVTTITQTPPTGAARITRYTYTMAGDIASVIFPDNSSLTYTYDDSRLLRQVTDNQNNQVRYGYDAKGNQTQDYLYDPAGTLVRQIDTAFDVRNYGASVNVAGSLTQLVNDAIGNLQRETDPNNNPAKQHSYDALNRLLQTVNRLNGTTHYTYDTNDRLTQVQAPNNATTTYQYDDLGNRLKEISPDRGTTTYTYDTAGNLKTKNDARNITTTYTYDVINRITQIAYPNSAENVTLTYDTCTLGIGKLCNEQDAAGTMAYVYDAFGNVLTQTKVELSKTYITRYTYDSMNRVLTMTYPDNRVVTYTRNAIGKVTQITATVGSTAQTIVSGRTYRADGVLLTQTFGNGLDESRQYDLQSRLTNQSLGSVDNRIYGYDYNGNPTSIQNATQNGTYTYDAEDRMTLDKTVVGTTTSSNTFTYDPNSNRTKINSAVYTHTANSNKLANAGGVAVTTDNAGNITQYGTDVYQYDGYGHLIQVTQNGTTKGTYSYNYLHQRTRKVAGSTTTVFHYDIFGNLILETTNTGTTKFAYVYDDSQSLIGHIKRASSVDTLTYVHADHEGTPRIGTNANKTVTWKWEGRAFGNTTATQDPDGNGTTVVINQRYGNAYNDSESGLWYVWNRYYRPGAGQWITSDPIGLRGGLNTYNYVSANPLRYTDPLGLCWIYSQSAGQLTHVDSDGNVTDVGIGYAGYGAGLNNPAMQNVAGDQPNPSGPPPQGTYTVGPQQLNITKAGVRLPASMRLIPNPTNQMFNRGGFLIHGPRINDKQSSSEGCPIFDKSIRDQIGNSGDNCFQVIQ